MKTIKLIILTVIAAISFSAQAQQVDTVDFSIWPKGEPNNGYAKHFTGNSYLYAYDAKNGGPVMVTFEPACINQWHIHHNATQVLIGEQGRGWAQIWGQEPVEMKTGTVVVIPAGTKHWHGAAKDSWFQHLTYMTNVGEGYNTEWLEDVEQKEYKKLK